MHFLCRPVSNIISSSLLRYNSWKAHRISMGYLQKFHVGITLVFTILLLAFSQMFGNTPNIALIKLNTQINKFTNSQHGLNQLWMRDIKTVSTRGGGGDICHEWHKKHFCSFFKLVHTYFSKLVQTNFPKRTSYSETALAGEVLSVKSCLISHLCRLLRVFKKTEF